MEQQYVRHIVLNHQRRLNIVVAKPKRSIRVLRFHSAFGTMRVMNKLQILLGRRMAEVRKRRGLKLNIFSDRLGVSRQQAHNWEAGRYSAADRLTEIAGALECREADLLAPLGSPIPRPIRVPFVRPNNLQRLRPTKRKPQS